MNTFKRLLSIVLLFGSQHLLAQKKVIIQGELQGYTNQAQVYFIYTDLAQGKEIVEPVRIKDGKLEKIIYISDPTELVMIMSPKGKKLNLFTAEERGKAEAVAFFIDEGRLSLKFDDAFAKVKLNPSKRIHEVYKTYRNIYITNRQIMMDSINRAYSVVRSEGTITLALEQVEVYKLAIANAEQQVIDNLLAFAKGNTNSYIGLLAMSSCLKAQPSLAPQLSELLAEYTTELQNTTLGKKLRIELEMSR